METINILGIDTSNYTTSIALIEFNKITREEKILKDLRIKLNVKDGEIGLRQSVAHFQHSLNLPKLFENIKGDKIDYVSVSTVPRRIEGSYMPVFVEGYGYGKTISNILNIPILEFSHQEGHIGGSFEIKDLIEIKQLIFMHFSGGTSEIIYSQKSEKGFDSEIIGGTLDISFGQLLDRIGVYMGFSFPAGSDIDRLAYNFLKDIMEKRDSIKEKNQFHYKLDTKGKDKVENPIKKIKVKDLKFNLSGVENQVKKILSSNDNIYSKDEIAYFLMERIGEIILEIIEQLISNRGIDHSPIIIGGGVGNSKFIREYLSLNSKVNIKFAKYSEDNAVGVGRLGGVFCGE